MSEVLCWKVRDVAKALGLSEFTVRKLAKCGRLPVINLTRGRLLFDRESILRIVRGDK
jgi:predicted site-specific integrase-resolvase